MNKREDAEQAIFDAIKTWNDDKEYGASFRDIALVTNISLGRTHEICRALRKAGKVSFNDHVARSLKVNDSLSSDRV